MISLLLIDDEPDILEITGMFLEKSGDIRVDKALSGKEGLEMLKTRNYDAVVSDYELSGMSGIAVLKAVRKSGNNIPFIIFTGKGREKVVIEALNEGADYYIQKGGDPKSQFAELSNSIKKAVLLRSSEMLIKESNRRLKEIIEFLPDATFAIDKKGVVIEWNQAMEKMSGVKREDMIGKGNYEYSYPFVGERRPILINQLIDPGSIKPESNYRITLEGDKITSEFFAPKLYGGKGGYLWLRASPLYGPAGEIEGAIESIRDISAIKQTESDLFEKNRMMETLMDNLPGVAYRCLNDSDWTMQFISAGCMELTGYSPEDIVNNAKVSYGSIIHPNDRMMVGDTIQESLCNLKPFQLLYRIISKSCEEKWVWEQGRGVFENGRLLALEGLILDISEGKLAHETMSELNKKLSLLNSITRHDVLNNLAKVMAFISLTEDETDPEKSRAYLKSAAMRLDKIRDQIIFTSEYQDLGIESSTWYNLYDIIDDLRYVAEDVDINVRNQTSGWEIYADPMIRGVFYNLIENTIRHGGDVKKIGIFASEVSGGLLIEYSDDGRGISIENKEMIFNPRYGENTGLGLFLIRQILGITGITIEENGDENGVLFAIFVPEGKYRPAE
ncbi:MAG: response regulator [Methanomicrobiaceae archaeon]|nr:response regulator [Methanomicrobiaceae archaeon]